MTDRHFEYMLLLIVMKTIRIENKTRLRLARFGFKLSSWDSIINALMDHAEKCDVYWNDIQ